MAKTYKVLAQNNPAATTNVALYTVPALTSAVLSTIAVCNQSLTSGATINIAVRPGGATLDPKHYIVYRGYVAPADSLFLTLGVTLATTDIVTIYSTTATTSFSLFGAELT